MMTDPVADMLTRIRNAARIEKPAVEMPASGIKIKLAQVLKDEGFVLDYQIGKYQIFKFLADARRVQGDAFKLRDFHNRLWREGNVPIALQRWEHLGLEDEVGELRKN